MTQIIIFLLYLKDFMKEVKLSNLHRRHHAFTVFYHRSEVVGIAFMLVWLSVCSYAKIYASNRDDIFIQVGTTFGLPILRDDMGLYAKFRLFLLFSVPPACEGCQNLFDF